MCETREAAEKALNRLSPHLTCSACNGPYQEPKVLPCLHVFCKTCLEKLVSRDSTVITCLKCRSTKLLPTGGVPNLQSPFCIEHLFEVQDTLEKVKDEKLICQHCREEKAMAYCNNCNEFHCQSCTEAHSGWTGFMGHVVSPVEEVQSEVVSLVPIKKEVLVCEKHCDTRLEVYCETCEKLICQNCLVKAHRDCTYKLVEDCFSEHRDAITASLQPVKQQLDTVNEAIGEIEARSGRLAEQTKSIKEKIDKQVEQLHEALEARKKELIAQVDLLVKQIEETLQAQKEAYEEIQKQLSSCLEYVEESLRTGTKAEILTIKTQVVDQLRQMDEQFDPQVVQPKPEQTLCFSHSGDTNTFRGLGKVFVISSISSPENGPTTENGPHAEMVFETFESPPYEQTVAFTYEEFQGVHTQTSTGLKDPRQLAVTARGEVVLAEKGIECVTVLNREGRKVCSFGHIGSDVLSSPRGVSLCSSNTVLVASEHCVQKYSFQGARLASVGMEGSGRLQFKSPWAVAFNPKIDKVYVCDTGNHRIQILNGDLTFSGMFGSKGHKEGQFSCPTSIAINSQGELFVTDFFNNRIQIFKSMGDFSREIKNRGPGLGVLKGPVSVCIDGNDNFFVFESNGYCVSMFNREGQLVKSFGRRGKKPGEFVCSYGIAVDTAGRVYVSDSHNHSIQVFK